MKNKKPKIKDQKFGAGRRPGREIPATWSLGPKKLHARGFVLLIAVLLASIILSIGLGISNFTYKELILSGTTRSSLYAFYAADTGIECAYYWDDILGTRPASAFGPKPPATTPPAPPPPVRPDEIYCNQQPINLTSTTRDDALRPITTFEFSLGSGRDDPSSPYVYVSVDKNFRQNSQTYTLMQARGSNNNSPNNQKRVERALQSRY